MILILIGLPGSGKSKFAKCLKRISNGVVYSFDDYMQQNFKGIRYDNVPWKMARKQFETRIQRDVCENSNKVYIIDDNHYYNSMRKAYRELARQCQIGYLQIVLDTPLKKCIERNNTRQQMVPVQVIQRMHSKMQFSTRDYIKVAVDYNVQDVWQCIQTQQQVPQQRDIHPEMPQLPQSDKHVKDIAIRKYISQRMNEWKEIGQMDLRKISQIYQEQKQRHHTSVEEFKQAAEEAIAHVKK